MAGQQGATYGAASICTVPGSDWTPSRFFGAWKERVAETKGDLILQYMHYSRGMPDAIRLEAIDCILRSTMPDVYVSDDRREAFDAMDNDGDAMREYATRFFDEFWDGYWKTFFAKRRADAEMSRQPSA